MALQEAKPWKLCFHHPHFLQTSRPQHSSSYFELHMWVRSCRTWFSLWHSSIRVPGPIDTSVGLRFLHSLALWLGSQCPTRRHFGWSHTSLPLALWLVPHLGCFEKAMSMRVKAYISLKSITLQVFWEVGRRMIQLISSKFFEAPLCSSVKAIPPYPPN